MTTIELSDEEGKIMGEVLQNSLKTMEVEIHQADQIDYKKQLKHRAELLRGLLPKISQPVSRTI